MTVTASVQIEAINVDCGDCGSGIVSESGSYSHYAFELPRDNKLVCECGAVNKIPAAIVKLLA